ncbi:MAG TPA: GAF domain-containing protein [Thermoleophilaceae bacterium]|jgi:GAF domain-containing protein/anti-sigma regulatory factor (Ser/Thr protein kinase)
MPDSRLEQIASLTEAALAHLSLDDLLDELLGRVRSVLAADTAAVLLLVDDEEALTVRATKGLPVGSVRIPVGQGFAGRVAAERQAVAIPDAETAEILNPALRERGIKSLLGVPLIVEGRLIGVLHVGSLAPREFTGEEADLLQMAADRLALAIDRARLFDAEHEARTRAERDARHLEQIQTITDAALGHLPTDRGLDQLLERVRDVLGADTAAILLLDPHGDELVARAARGLEEEVDRGVRIPVGGGFAGRIAAAGAPVVLDDVDHADVLNPLLREKGVRSLLGVPLLAEGRVLGVLHVGTLKPRDFTPNDVALLERAAERIGLALDRARHHNVAEVLQRSLLPGRLPAISGVATAVLYRPSADDAHVGGDWYDLVPLADGRVGLAMGDVVSRGVPAAAAMGQMRTALRAYAMEGDSPGVVLDRLDRYVRHGQMSEMATVAYGVLDPGSGELTYSLAAHPPPLRVRDGGEAEFLEGIRSRPIGVTAAGSYPEVGTVLERRETLLLYTDGLVERRGESLDVGLERLRSAVSGVPATADEVCLAAVAELEVAVDDVAVLTVQRTPVPPDRLRLALPAAAQSLAEMRSSLRDWLSSAGAPASDAYDVMVAVGEAAANAIEHAYGPVEAEFGLDVDLVEGRIVAIELRDSGRWRSARGEHRGRGLSLMRALMDEVDVAMDHDGTVVRMSRALGGGAA